MIEISVIVPVYNVDLYIEKCITSILEQTFTNFELILIDDGSIDESGNICEEFAKKDDRIVVIHKNNGGLSSARNAGLDISVGKYIMFVDSDDYIAKDALKTMYDIMEENRCDIVISNNSFVYDDNFIFNSSMCHDIQTIDSKEAINRLCSGNLQYVTVWAKLYKSVLWKDVRFPIGKYNEDVFVQHKEFYQSEIIIIIDKVLYGYRQRESSIMGSKQSYKYVDCLEAYMHRIHYLSKKDGYKIEIEKTVRMFWYWFFNYIPQMYDNELFEKLKKLKKHKLCFLYYHFQDDSRSMKERIALSILLINPKLYKKFFVRD